MFYQEDIDKPKKVRSKKEEIKENDIVGISKAFVNVSKANALPSTQEMLIDLLNRLKGVIDSMIKMLEDLDD